MCCMQLCSCCMLRWLLLNFNDMVLLFFRKHAVIINNR